MLGALFIILIVSIGALLFFAGLLYSTFAGAPYVASTNERVEQMFDLVALAPEERFLDLGSGDGRIVIAAARRGAMAEGVEINPWLVLWSRWKVRRAGLTDRARIRLGSISNVSLAPFNVVSLYCMPSMMAHLEKKLQNELPPGGRVVSNGFTFPTWVPTAKEGSIRVYKNK